MQRFKFNRLVVVLLAVLVAALTIIACASPTAAPAPEAPAAEAPAAEEPAAEEPAPAAEGESYVIGVSNGFVGSEWRTQMLANMEEVAQELGVELVIESGDVDIQGQTQQIQNLMNRGVDAIIVNPNDQQALNPVLEEAAEAGIVVIAVDQEVAAEGVYNVAIDQAEWARISARWVAEQMGGEGDLVLIEGFVGHPGNEDRMRGVEDVLAEYPNIEVVGRDTGMWDPATSQQVTSQFLASGINIDAVWTQDGMAEGALQAVRTARPNCEDWPIMVGEARMTFMNSWAQLREECPDFSTIAVVNPPGVGASGLRVAYEILQGGQPDPAQLSGRFGNTLYVPIPGVITDDNFEEEYAEVEGRPASHTLDGFITQEEAAAFMQ
jgi:ribose transport system substrate-binding protein